MDNERIREVGLEIIEEHIGAFLKMAEYDRDGRPETFKENTSINGEWEDRQFGSII